LVAKEKKLKEALFYEKLEGERVRCSLCHHNCIISEGKRGICSVRENRSGVLYSLVYGRIVSANPDPIEKKPLFHFLPGSFSFSIATVGCNFSCLHCQNYTISQLPRETGEVETSRKVPPEAVVSAAVEYNCKTIAHTYTEPTIFYEYAYDVAKLAKDKGIRSIFVTNGYIGEEALRHINPYLAGANVDLKGFREETYKSTYGARLAPVLENIKLMKKLGIWIEVTTLVIPTINDSDEELSNIACFIAGVGVDIPWHISRFHPDYKLTNLPPTPRARIDRAREIGKEAGLRYVYSGNIPGDEGEHTYCYQCGTPLIKRFGFQIIENKLKEGRCPDCGAMIDGVWR
jgi:pyruvate formate lyase activating enzyme